MSHLSNGTFGGRILTDYEEKALHVKVKHSNQWVMKGETQTPQTEETFHPLICFVGVTYLVRFEIVNSNQMITKEIYCEQLERLKSEAEER